MSLVELYWLADPTALKSKKELCKMLNYNNTDNAVYSDRLYQWDYQKYDECFKTVWGNTGQYFNGRSSSDIEKFLCLYLGKSVELTAVVEGCNASSGYPYWVFFFEPIE
jgi:hypothetical protein